MTSAAGDYRAVEHLSRERLEAGLGQIRESPRDAGRQLRLRGMNARVVVPGTVRLGDLTVKAPAGMLREPSANPE